MGPVGSLPLRLEEKTTQYRVPGRSSPETPILILTVVTTLTTQGIMGSWDEHASVFEKQRLKALMRNSWSNQIPVLLTHKAVLKTPQNVKRRMATEPSNSAPGCVSKRNEDASLLTRLYLVGHSSAGVGRAQIYTVPLSLTSGSVCEQTEPEMPWVVHRSWRWVPR